MDRNRAGSGRRDERGIALVLSMLVLSILIILVTQFAWSTKVERRIAANSRDDLKMLYAARGCVSYAKALLRANRVKNPAVDSLRQDWSDTQYRPQKIGDVVLRGPDGGPVRFEDCESRINVNLFAKAETKSRALEFVQRLGQRLNIEPAAELAARIGDFVDEDADGDYEAGARNTELFHANELLAMQGLTEELKDALTGFKDPDTGEAKPGILQYLTTFGNKKVNLNTAEDPVLYAIIPDQNAQQQPVNREEGVQQIISYRTTGDASSSPGGTPAATPGVSGQPGEERPGKDFTKIDELTTACPALAGILPAATAQGSQPQPQPQPGGAQQTPPPSLRRFLDVVSQDFRIEVIAERGNAKSPIRKQYEVILRRGQTQFDVIAFREVDQ